MEEKNMSIEEELLADETSPASETKKDKDTWYGYCRIPGGMQFHLNSGKEEKTIILKSGTEKISAPDGTVSYRIRPNVFGVTELSRSEKQQIEGQIKNSRVYQAGFIFFAQSKDAGDKRAEEQVKKNPDTGMEPLDASSLMMDAQVYKE